MDRSGELWLCTIGQGSPEARLRGPGGSSGSTPQSRGTEHPAERHGALAVRGCGRRDVARYPERRSSPVIRKPPPFVNYMHRGGEPGQPCRRHDLVRAGRQPRRPVDRDGDGPPPARSTDTTGSLSIGTTRRIPTACPATRSPRFARTPSGALWIGTYGGGLDRFDAATGRFVHYRHDPKDPRSLDNDLVLSVFFDRKGVLWVGTQAGALSRFDRASGRFTVVSELWAVLRQLNIRGPRRDPLACGQ